ncbi:hypothetical protein TB1_012616 [Malus domestica]
MAFFISKLSKECDQCQKIIDRSSIKTIRFESDMSTPHQILGPLFKAVVPPTIIGLLKEHCGSTTNHHRTSQGALPITLAARFEWSKWDLARP